MGKASLYLGFWASFHCADKLRNQTVPTAAVCQVRFSAHHPEGPAFHTDFYALPAGWTNGDYIPRDEPLAGETSVTDTVLEKILRSRLSGL